MSIKLDSYDYTNFIGKNAKDISEEINDCPRENRYLYNGKIYYMEYYEDSKRLTDTCPLIISLGAAKNNQYFYGINFHYIPQKIRPQVLDILYKSFATLINKEINNYPNKQDSLKQMPLEKFTRENITHLASTINLNGAVHRYFIKDIHNAYTLNYNQMHVLINDTNYKFNNGTINDALKEFMSDML